MNDTQWPDGHIICMHACMHNVCKYVGKHARTHARISTSQDGRETLAPTKLIHSSPPPLQGGQAGGRVGSVGASNLLNAPQLHPNPTHQKNKCNIFSYCRRRNVYFTNPNWTEQGIKRISAIFSHTGDAETYFTDPNWTKQGIKRVSSHTGDAETYLRTPNWTQQGINSSIHWLKQDRHTSQRGAITMQLHTPIATNKV